MANRAKAKSKKATTGKVKSRGKVATLPKQKGRKVGVGHNGAPVDESTIKHHHAALRRDLKAIADIVEELDQAKGVYRSTRKAAKKARINLAAFDFNRKLEEDDQGKIHQDIADAVRYQNVMGSKLVQLQLFNPNLEGPAPPEVDAKLQGFNAGKGGEKAENNPHVPGTEHFETWATGWVEGQAAIAKGIGKSPRAAQLDS